MATTHTTYINNDTAIDTRTIRRLETQVADAATQDRTDGRVGWSYYGIDTDGNAWTWTQYNGDPEPHHEGYLIDRDEQLEPEMYDHIMAVADEIEEWDADHAQWLRETIRDVYAD
jgi:hypothetical protein